MRVLFFGSSEFAVPTFESIRDGGHTLVGAVTQPDRVRGRGRTMSPTPVKKMALSCDVPVFTPENVNTAETVEQLKSLGADVGYVASFGQKFGREMLDAFPAGLINLHASLLPALRGAAPIQWAIINGDAATGVTVFRIVEKMDAGP
ncbi:MAG: methionyl-tRNA formyltransferase, partial [Planctomycetota bacterium]|nr:methionyl-tRNA formyltransferase [Planctomycetota bacterium]